MNPAVMLFQMFWVGVCDELRQRLQDKGHYRNWEVFLWPDAETPELFCHRYAGLLIAWRGRPHYPSCWGGCFSVLVERISTGAPARYGIERGIQYILAANRDPRDAQLRQGLLNQGFQSPPNPHGSWLAFRNLQDNQNPMLPTFTINNQADVNALDEELNDAARPLTAQTVNLIWELFDNHRQALEDLNQNYPYPPHNGRWWTHPYAH